MNRAEELIADLEAEIVKRDARIESLLSDSKALARNLKGKHALTGATYEHLASRCDRLQAELEQQRGGVVPDGWVPLTIEHEPGYPEDVAFGPQRMMDRLKKWLDRYFAMRLNQPGECVAVSRDTLETALDNLLSILSDDEPLIEELRALLTRQGKAVG